MNVITALHCVVNSAYVDLIKVTYFTTEVLLQNRVKRFNL